MTNTPQRKSGDLRPCYEYSEFIDDRDLHDLAKGLLMFILHCQFPRPLTATRGIGGKRGDGGTDNITLDEDNSKLVLILHLFYTLVDVFGM